MGRTIDTSRRGRGSTQRTDLRVAAFGIAACLAALMAPAGGFGGATDSQIVGTTVEPVVTITPPTSINSSPAPANSPTWQSGSPGRLSLGELRGTEYARASLTWKIMTNSPAGYTLQLANTRTSGSVLQTSQGDEYPDMGSQPKALNLDASAFGIAVGNGSSHNEAAAAYSGSPWGTTGSGGTQGTLFRGVPSAGTTIAGRVGPVTDDPVTVTFASTLAALDPITRGSFNGSVRMTATTL